MNLKVKLKRTPMKSRNRKKRRNRSKEGNMLGMRGKNKKKK